MTLTFWTSSRRGSTAFRFGVAGFCLVFSLSWSLAAQSYPPSGSTAQEAAPLPAWLLPIPPKPEQPTPSASRNLTDLELALTMADQLEAWIAWSTKVADWWEKVKASSTKRAAADQKLIDEQAARIAQVETERDGLRQENALLRSQIKSQTAWTIGGSAGGIVVGLVAGLLIR